MRIKEANHDEHQFRPLLPLNNCYMMHHFLTMMICFALTSNSSKWKDRGCGVCWRLSLEIRVAWEKSFDQENEVFCPILFLWLSNFTIHCDEGLTLETSAFKFFTVANLR